MKISVAAALTCLFLIPIAAFAQSPFNGTFCGNGTLTMRINGHTQTFQGTKVLTLLTTDTSLESRYDRIYFKDASWMQGQLISDQIENQKVLINGQDVGSISADLISTSVTVSGLQVNTRVQILETGKISFSRRTSGSAGLLLGEEFSQLASGPTCVEKP